MTLTPPSVARGLHFEARRVQIALGNAEGASCCAAMRDAAVRYDEAADSPAAHTSTADEACAALPWTGATKSKEVSWQEITDADPDVIIVCGCGFDLARNRADAKAVFRDNEDAACLRAVQEGRLYALDGNRTLSRPGPGLAEGAAAIAACVWYEHEACRQALSQTGCLPEEDAVWGRLQL